MDWAMDYTDYTCDPPNETNDKPSNCVKTEEQNRRSGGNLNIDLPMDQKVDIPDDLRRITVTFTHNEKAIAEVDFCAGPDEAHITQHNHIGDYEAVGEWAKG